MGFRHRHIDLLLLLLVTYRYSSAQSPPSPNNQNGPNTQNVKLSPSIAIIIVVLISVLFFLVFFSIYIRNRDEPLLDPRSTAGGRVGTAAGRSLRQRGINPEVLGTFPTFAFSEVKAHKIGKSALECAVCLCEFEDDETLRLLPECDHVFHTDCIDAWLAAHVTCPVCRRNLEEVDAASPEAVGPIHEPAVQESTTPAQVDNQQVTIQIEEEDEERKAEIESLKRFIDVKRSRSRAARPARLPRSHSTGHSSVLPGENLERFTLRLPESVRRDVLQRATSRAAFPVEGRSRRGYRRGEGSMGRGARSIQLGSPEGWGSFVVRTLSVKNWGRRGVGDESIRRERSVQGKSCRRGNSIKFGAQTSAVD